MKRVVVIQCFVPMHREITWTMQHAADIGWPACRMILIDLSCEAFSKVRTTCRKANWCESCRSGAELATVGGSLTVFRLELFANAQKPTMIEGVVDVVFMSCPLRRFWRFPHGGLVALKAVKWMAFGWLPCWVSASFTHFAQRFPWCLWIKTTSWLGQS